jgi:hypothetical protein
MYRASHQQIMALTPRVTAQKRTVIHRHRPKQCCQGRKGGAFRLAKRGLRLKPGDRGPGGSKYPPAKPVALICELLKAAVGSLTRPRFAGAA